uniref:Uncharacterized protein n=1 Tax=Odontella aurita TaxID=265563 RepID=A0A7S4IKR5_9STRA
MAMKDNPGCVGRLDLGHNRITDDGAVAIGRALALRPKGGGRREHKTIDEDDVVADFVMESIDFSGNKDLGDDGAAALAAALECGALRSVYLRSCAIRSDGAAAFGKALLAYLASASREQARREGPFLVNVDLSGNDLGTLRAKKKAKPYSPSLLKSKASATTASYMNFIGKKIKSGLKDAGLMEVSQAMGNFIPSSESDDEEEALMGLDEKDDEKSPAARCGARSFAEAFVCSNDKENILERTQYGGVQQGMAKGVKCIVGMRQTSLDEGAADALAAITVRARDTFQINVSIDAKMNDALGRESISALQGMEEEEVLLRSMAKRHLDAVEALRIARQRAAEAAEAAAARARAEEMMSGAFGEPAEDSDFDSMFPGDPDEYAYDNDEYMY